MDRIRILAVSPMGSASLDKLNFLPEPQIYMVRKKVVESSTEKKIMNLFRIRQCFTSVDTLMVTLDFNLS